jgi:hypothetical protein
MKRIIRALILLAAGFAPALAPAQAPADSNSPWGGGCAIYEPRPDGTACIPSAAVVCTCKLSAHASAVLPAVSLDLKTGNMAAGVDVVPLGLCYGLTYKPTLWYASGADLCVQAKLASSSPNQLGFALMLNLADYLSAGIGTLATQEHGTAADGTPTTSLVWHGMFYLSPRLPIQ